MHPRIPFLGLALAFLTVAGIDRVEAGFVVDWQAASGDKPDEIATPWSYVDNTDGDAALAGGILTLSTSQTDESTYYIETGSILDMSSPFFIEANLKFVSGASNAAYRAPISIGLTVEANVGNALYIGQDEVFFATGDTSTGTKVSVDTSDAFHTYRIEYDGSGGLELFYDGNAAPLLTGSTFNSSSFNGPDERIIWGEFSIHTVGVSQWTSFQHNATVPEPSSAVALLGVCGALGYRARRRKRRSSQA